MASRAIAEALLTIEIRIASVRFSSHSLIRAIRDTKSHFRFQQALRLGVDVRASTIKNHSITILGPNTVYLA